MYYIDISIFSFLSSSNNDSSYQGILGLRDIPPGMVKNSHNEEVVKLLLNVFKSNPLVISNVVPRNIQSNSMFVVDLSKLEHPDDVFSDDLGSWKQTDTSKKFYRLREEDSSVSVICNIKTKMVDSVSITLAYEVNCLTSVYFYLLI